MKKQACGLFFSACGLLLAWQLSAEAGFVSIGLRPLSGSTAPLPDYEANPEEATLNVVETWGAAYGYSYGFDVIGTTDADPPLHITKDVTNGTNLTWVGYTLSLNPLDPHTFELLSPVPSSNAFTLVSSSPTQLVFGLPNPVGPGNSVLLDFVINVVTTGQFSFSLTQSPIAVPEPSAVLLVTLSFAAFVSRRRVRS